MRHKALLCPLISLLSVWREPCHSWIRLKSPLFTSHVLLAQRHRWAPLPWASPKPACVLIIPCQGPGACSSCFLPRRRQVCLSHDPPNSLFLTVAKLPFSAGTLFTFLATEKQFWMKSHCTSVPHHPPFPLYMSGIFLKEARFGRKNLYACVLTLLKSTEQQVYPKKAEGPEELT